MRLDVRVVPNARRDEVIEAAEGRLRVRVQAPAVDGKANDALRRVLAHHFGVRSSKVTIVRGARSRDKTVQIDTACT